MSELARKLSGAFPGSDEESTVDVLFRSVPGLKEQTEQEVERMEHFTNYSKAQEPRRKDR